MARAYRSQGNPLGVAYMLASLLTLGCSIAILVIVNVYLWSFYTYYPYSYYYASTTQCYMQTLGSSGNICYYSWVAGGFGIFFSLFLFFMQVCSGRSRHMPACEIILCLVSLAWWIAAATTATVYGKDADNAPLTPPGPNTAFNTVLHQKEGYRTAVWACGWANVGLWALCCILSFKDCFTYRGAQPTDADHQAYPMQGAYVASSPVYQTAPPPQGAYYYPPPGGVPQQPYAQQPYAQQPYGQPYAGAQQAPPPPSPFGASAAGYPPPAGATAMAGN